MAEGPIELEIDFLGPILDILGTGSADSGSDTPT